MRKRIATLLAEIRRHHGHIEWQDGRLAVTGDLPPALLMRVHREKRALAALRPPAG